MSSWFMFSPYVEYNSVAVDCCLCLLERDGLVDVVEKASDTLATVRRSSTDARMKLDDVLTHLREDVDELVRLLFLFQCGFIG